MLGFLGLSPAGSPSGSAADGKDGKGAAAAAKGKGAAAAGDGSADDSRLTKGVSTAFYAGLKFTGLAAKVRTGAYF